MRTGHLRGSVARRATSRQQDILAAYAVAGGSVQGAAQRVGIQRDAACRRILAGALVSLRAGADLERVGPGGRAVGVDLDRVADRRQAARRGPGPCTRPQA